MAVRDWTFGGTWPYEPRWFETTDGRVAYVDEGEGRPVVGRTAADPRVPPGDPGGSRGPGRRLRGRVGGGPRRALAGKPVAFAWPMQDPAFTPEYLDRWLETFPDAEVTRLDEASHYVQEDAHEVVIPRLLEFLER